MGVRDLQQREGGREQAEPAGHHHVLPALQRPCAAADGADALTSRAALRRGLVLPAARPDLSAMGAASVRDLTAGTRGRARRAWIRAAQSQWLIDEQGVRRAAGERGAVSI